MVYLPLLMCGDLMKLSRFLPIDGDDNGISAIDELLCIFHNDVKSVAEKLHPAACLSRYFNESLPDLCLHLIVQVPISVASGTKFLPSPCRPLAQLNLQQLL
jgi:hypothetical protein